MKFLLFAIISTFGSHVITSQDVLYLKNASFEDIPRMGKTGFNPLKGWDDCGQAYYPKESAPDILPTKDKVWGIDLEPFDGETYLALVARKNKTFESVGQRLPAQLLAGACYSLTIRLALAQDFDCSSSTKPLSGDTISFSNPLKLTIWGGKSNCAKDDLLGESVSITSERWEFHEITLSPTVNCTNIILEAAFVTDSLRPYNGHILVDNLSPIIQQECPKSSDK